MGGLECRVGFGLFLVEGLSRGNVFCLLVF